jgi:tetratricopeptide (TPR) repeat protein
MVAGYATELERLLDQARELLGSADDATLVDANLAVNHALRIAPDSVDAWLLKCQVASAQGDDHAALAACEMALHRSPHRADALYWRGAVLGDLGRHREALRAIEASLRVIDHRSVALGRSTDLTEAEGGEHWLLEDLFYEKTLVLDALGLHDAAVAACESGLTRCPGSALLRTALAPAERARTRSSL